MERAAWHLAILLESERLHASGWREFLPGNEPVEKRRQPLPEVGVHVLVRRTELVDTETQLLDIRCPGCSRMTEEIESDEQPMSSDGWNPCELTLEPLPSRRILLHLYVNSPEQPPGRFRMASLPIEMIDQNGRQHRLQSQVPAPECSDSLKRYGANPALYVAVNQNFVVPESLCLTRR